MKRFIILMIAAGALLCSCKPHLVILHTNDTHSHFEALRDSTAGVIERAAFIDSVREAEGAGNVLLLHAGDWNQGSSYYSRLGGRLEVDVINAMGYDAVTLGNHEFDDGIESLTERVKRLSCPVVCANLDLRSFELGKYVHPYTILYRAGRKIGVIGLEADISSCVSKVISSRIPQLEPVPEVNRWAEYLKGTEKCDLVIVLSHQGYPEDQANVAGFRGVDLVIGGHSHTFVDGFVYPKDLDGKPVPVITDGCWGIEMGKITL